MGGSTDGELNRCRPRYDISMSKRTRKSRMSLDEALVENDAKRFFADQGRGLDKGLDRLGEDNDDQMSWKELVTKIINSKEEHPKEVEEPADDHGEPRRISSGEPFTAEENKLQLMTNKRQELVQGLKFYVKVLSLFKKAKQVEPVYKAGNIRPKNKKHLFLW